MSRQQPFHGLPLALAVAAAALATLTATTGPPAGPPHHTPPRLPLNTHAAHARTQAVLNEIVTQGTPGVIAQIRDARGVWDGRAGVGDLAGERPRSTSEKFRIASVTKTFTATVLLALEAEGRISLDDSVEEWLPAVVRGKGYRPGNITVRHLLNHTSSIFDYNMDESFRTLYAGDAFDHNRHTRWSPQQLVDIALAHPPNFQPEQGSRPGRPGRWDYSDTNYVLAGMVIEKATGGTYAQAVERLIHPAARPARHECAGHLAPTARPARQALLHPVPGRTAGQSTRRHRVQSHRRLLRRADDLNRRRRQHLPVQTAGR